MGNVAETATANVFMVKDGEVFTPIANGTFLAGITRARHIANLRADGVEVVETVLTFDDFHAADEVFLSGNMNKVTPVTAFDDTQYQVGPLTRRVRELYWDWARPQARAMSLSADANLLVLNDPLTAGCQQFRDPRHDRAPLGRTDHAQVPGRAG